jgi:hypothetical protein
MKLSKICMLLTLPFILPSCEKWTDAPGSDDPRLGDRKYCNIPDAVNYNWGFPGKPDSTVCFFPSDLFSGTYQFKDSVYLENNTFDSVKSQTSYTLHIYKLTKNRFALVGLCGIMDSLKFTAERTTYRATGDSTIKTSDTTVGHGQFFCRSLDTLTGFILKPQSDSNKLILNFRVVSDTGVNFHRGTAIKL